MASRDRGNALRHMRTLFSVGVIGELTDSQLLERFVSGRDPAAEMAFRALVERHGPMVLRVCRAVLRDAAGADDAFQATFLVLAHRAGSLWVRDSLAPWLQQVAHRTASSARKAEVRRRHHELRSGEQSAASYIPAEHDDLERVIQDELSRLPGNYRDAVVLCLLEGLTPDQAARHLRCPVGTVHSRLARGRELLRGRLTRRGLTVPAGLFTVSWTRDGASASVPSVLADQTIRAVLGVAAEHSLLSVASESVIALTGAVLRAMFFTRLATVGLSIAILGGLGIGAGVVARQTAADRPVRRPEAAGADRADGVAAKNPAPMRGPARVNEAPGDSRSKQIREVPGDLPPRPPSIVSEMAMSPDGKTIVLLGNELIARDALTGEELWRASGDEYPLRGPAAGYGMQAVAFSPDGSRFYTPAKGSSIVAWEAATGRHELVRLSSAIPGPLPPAIEAALSIDVSPDGQRIAVGYVGGIAVCERTGNVLHRIEETLYERPGGGSTARIAAPGSFCMGRFSPNGEVLAVVSSGSPEEIRLCDPESGKTLRTLRLASRLVKWAFSSDGRRIAAIDRVNVARLYEVETGRRLWSRVVTPPGVFPSGIAFSPDGKTLAASATDHRIRLLAPETGEETGQLSGQLRYPWLLAFTPNSKILFSSGWDPKIRRWDLATRKELP